MLQRIEISYGSITIIIKKIPHSTFKKLIRWFDFVLWHDSESDGAKWSWIYNSICTHFW